MSEMPRLGRDVDVIRQTVMRIERCLPPSWKVVSREEVATDLWGRTDAVIELVPPSGKPIVLVAEVKRSVVMRDLQAMADQLDRMVQGTRASKIIPLVIARYLPPPSQAWLAERGISYADATGNLWIASKTPVLFLRDVGATSDPWRGPGRPRGTLKGEPAARVVRALADFPQPMTVPELINLSGASSGATYRVVDFLAEQALIERGTRGPIETVAWRRLLEAWARDYGFNASNPVRTFLQPRGLLAISEGLRRVESRYAVTGSLAAQNWAPYAPTKAATIYADDPDDVARELGLREVDTGANTLIAVPAYDVVFDRARQYKGVVTVAPSQAAVDLLTGPGRGPSEAQALLDWMEANVNQWRG